MKSLYWLLTKRYMCGIYQQKTVGVMIAVSFMSTFIAACSLTLVLCIMNGLEHATLKTFQSIHPEIIVSSPQQELNIDALNHLIRTEFPAIKATSAFALAHGMLRSGKQYAPILLKVIDPHHEHQVTDLNAIMHPTPLIANRLHDSNIAIGATLAHQLGLTINDTVMLMLPEEQSAHTNVHFDHVTVTITHLIKTGIEELDSSLVLSDIHLFEQHDIAITRSHMGIALHDKAAIPSVVQRLKKRTGLAVYPWQDLYPALVSALKLEKYAMTFIMSFMLLIASMGIISLLYVLINFKRSDIAILQTMGLSPTAITLFFGLFGIGINIVAGLLGLVIAYVIGFICDHFHLIKLPDAYYVSYLPVMLDWHNFVIVLCITILVSAIAAWLGLRTISSAIIANVLKEKNV